MAQRLEKLIGLGLPLERMNLLGKLLGSWIPGSDFENVVAGVAFARGLKRVTEESRASGEGLHQETRIAVPHTHGLKVPDDRAGERDIVGVAGDPIRRA